MIFVVGVFGLIYSLDGIKTEDKNEDSLKLLQEGNDRFLQMKLQHPNENIPRRVDTAVNGQKPFAIILACSDSREPVELIFDRGIGDLFVVRAAGNVAMDSSVIGSIEYGAKHLNVPLIVILGHTDCGAVKAGLSNSTEDGKILDIQNKIKQVVEKTKNEYPNLNNSDLLYPVTKNNVFQTKTDLLTQSQIIKELVDEGKLRIVTAVYDIRTGKVEWIE